MSPARATSARAVAEAVRADVLAGRLAPGTPLREEALAAAHGVSRHTVRSALAVLVAERLVTYEEFRGARVARLDDDEVRALQDLRAALECEAVRLLATRHPDGWPPSVTQVLTAAVDALGATDPDDWPAVERAHAQVHVALVEAAGSPRITEAYRALTAEMHLLLLHARRHYDVPALVAEHTAYLADVRRRGPAAVREHLTHLAALLRTGR
ncbi:GntR family transcriptional regulator [Cellulomonas sp. SLBN-39]|uniref:GntR family transcriptional regulator n=1 Tax=Cellulomonas sp. SLBN-39 TaxID=2768446 RepID=UPI001153D1E2|nr:GntR family transcriptional regulator [Cellulomonas sp. SLBN-39]TQL02397.1 DNA-binding GntR family transcriptional regulator [Cellulomonas sp. SLBN-39]